jgi:hypothetical protein
MFQASILKKYPAEVDSCILLLFLCCHSLWCDLFGCGKRHQCLELRIQAKVAISFILGNQNVFLD